MMGGGQVVTRSTNKDYQKYNPDPNLSSGDVLVGVDGRLPRGGGGERRHRSLLPAILAA